MVKSVVFFFLECKQISRCTQGDEYGTMHPMKFRLPILFFVLLAGGALRAQYQDYSRMGKTPAELMFIDDPMVIELKEPSWFWHNPKRSTPMAQLIYAADLERSGKTKAALEAYDDLVHEWHSTPEALKAQLALARLYSATGEARKAYDEEIYLLAHFAGRFELEPVLADAVAQADLLVARERDRNFRLNSGASLRQNYERIIHFAPRWHRVPEMMLKIAELYVCDEDYSGAITICDRVIVDWPAWERMDDVISLYCEACRKQADVWKNDTGRLKQLERLIAGARTFRPLHPDLKTFTVWQQEVYELRRACSYEKAVFYDNPAAYSAEAAVLAYQTFLREFPDASEAESVRARLAELSLVDRGEKKESN